MPPLHPHPLLTDTNPVDEDLAKQANPGHGIPSQDPDPAAQTLLDTAEAEREVHSVLIGGGVVAGAVAGAAIGVAVSGPVGGLVGSTIGAVAGALGATAVGTAATPEDAETPKSKSNSDESRNVSTWKDPGR